MKQAITLLVIITTLFVIKKTEANSHKNKKGIEVSVNQERTPKSKFINLKKNSRIILIGGNLGSRMMNYGHFETELHLRNPDKKLYIRNMCDGGNTPAFRPHSGRKPNLHFAFPGAEKFYPQYQKGAGHGFNETPDQWLTRHKPDIIVGFFGYTESFEGESGLVKYKEELAAFIDHTLKQKYNGRHSPKLALVSPTAFQDLSSKYDYPNGVKENKNLAMYTAAMKSVAQQKNILFIDSHTPSKTWFDTGKELTIDGSQLNEKGYKLFSKLLADELFGKQVITNNKLREKVKAAVLEKNWYWHNDFKIPNGVHVFGRRHKPFGPKNYPFEIKKLRQLTANRDLAIWHAVINKDFDLKAADAKTMPLPKIETNYKADKKNGRAYIPGDASEKKIKVAKGYKIELFASEKKFPDLANPVQMSFDNKGRLWVSVMPSYPHWKPGDSKPNDKILILEDTDNDGKADKQIIFAENLHLPMGFEISSDGVYIAQGSDLLLLKDTDGDDKADTKEIVFSGFDDHDTHHTISAFTADPSGAIIMGEGIYLSSHIETSYGTVRGTNGGFYRFDPKSRQLERTAQLKVPNPWGTAFDDYGNCFFLYTSNPAMSWMDPYRLKAIYGQNLGARNILTSNRVRPTSGLEFISSRHFPNEVQGDVLICNTIFFRGAKQHQVLESGTGFTSKFRHNLFSSDDANFRPVDLEFAPDGSLYVVDWHNKLIGHAQHNSRDPNRDYTHGRIYRITYPSRPLVKPAKIHGASIIQLLENLKLPEYRTRYRTRRELRKHKPKNVLPSLKKWVAALDNSTEQYEKYLLEALWVTWGLNAVDKELLQKCLSAKDHRVRTAAVQVLRYNMNKIPNSLDLVKKAAGDKHGRVVMAVINIASYLEENEGMDVLSKIDLNKVNNDKWLKDIYKVAQNTLMQKTTEDASAKVKAPGHLKADEKKLFLKGHKIYMKEGSCATCHQKNGKGLPNSGFPPLDQTKWVLESEERLIKLTLKGLMGKITVKGKEYPGLVPMTPFEGLLDDEAVAAVLTYVRNSFGNKAQAIKPEAVKDVRIKIKNKKGFYSPSELLKLHPHKNK